MNKVDEFKRRDYRTRFDRLSGSFDDTQVIDHAGIFCRIDWFTAVFTDCTVLNALYAITRNTTDVTDDFDRVFTDRFFASQGYLPDVVFNFDGVVVKISEHDVLTSLKDVSPEEQDNLNGYSFFDLVFRKIRVDISGSGLDRLRQKGVDVDSFFWAPLPLATDQMNYHVTRCDVAFDFIDYNPSFLSDCISWCQDNGNKDTQRIAVGDSRGLKYSIRTGDQMTLYLGAGTSDRLLRVYDKRMQYDSSGKVFPYVYNDGSFPESWIRCELQCRREKETHTILYSHSSVDPDQCFLDVFRYVYDRFGFYKDGKTVDFWRDFFDWDMIPGILQKSYFVQSYVPVFERSYEWFTRSAFASLCIIVSRIGWKSFQDNMNKQFTSLQSSLNPCDKLRFTSLLVKLLDNKPHLPDFLYRDQTGLYHIGDPC